MRRLRMVSLAVLSLFGAVLLVCMVEAAGRMLWPEWSRWFVHTADAMSTALGVMAVVLVWVHWKERP